MQNTRTALTRRTFVTSAAAATAASLTVAPAARADEAEQAPATPDWLGEAPEIDESQVVDTLSCDVLVVGGGTSGMFAACSAAENGAQTILIEKNPLGPGIRGSVGAIGSRYQLEDDCDIKAVDILRDMQMYSASNVDPKLLRLWADESAETVEWYGDVCVAAGREFGYNADHDLDDVRDIMRYRHWATSHVNIKDGRTSEDDEVLVAYFQDNGGQILYSTAMIKLVQDETGRVTGVYATNEDDGLIRIDAAKGVLVCTGGYARNQDMLNALQPDTVKNFSYNSGLPGTTGDGIKACLWAGAAFDEAHTSMLFDRCPLPPDGVSGDPSDGMFWMGSQPWLKVNLKGERFTNESEPYDLTLHAALNQPDHTYAIIIDSNWMEYIPQFKTQGCSRMFPFSNGTPVSAVDLDANMGMFMGMQEAGFVQSADTIEELAEKLGIPGDTLAATVARQNENYANGEDPDFGKEAFRLSPIDTPPYYGVRMTGYMLCTLDGIKINESMNAINEHGDPIEGLYVCGNDSGSFFAYTYPDLITGLAAGRSTTFGRRAGRIAATQE